MNNSSFSIAYSDSTGSTKTPATKEIRQRLRNQLRESIKRKENVVYRSPTASGKTYSSVTTAWRQFADTTGGEPVVYLAPTTDARDDAESKAKNSNAQYQKLVGREDACPIVRGVHDDDMDAPDGKDPSEWFEEMTDNRGLPVSVAHDHFERYHDGDIPCSSCKLQTQWNDVPRNEDGTPNSDVVIATHQIAHAQDLIDNCNVIIDELPDFREDKEVEDFRRSITSYLQHIEAPVQTWEKFIVNYLEKHVDTISRHQFSQPKTNWFLEDEDAHVLTPGIVDAVLKAEQRVHGRWVGETVYQYPDLNPYSDSNPYQIKIRVVIDDQYDIKILQALPDFSEARCVVGLDAFPTKAKWNKNTLDSIEFKRILTDEEEQLWRKNERNLKIIQVGDNKYSWTLGGHNQQKVRGLCSEIQYYHDDALNSGITAQRCETDVENDMEAVGIADPEIIHYGNEKSVNKLDSETVGALLGCISPSSDHIKDWLALLDKHATPKREEDEDYEGQQWDGPDAEVAHELLADVREKRVLQGVGRYARSPGDPDDEATVYVMTNVLDDKWIDESIAGVNVLTDKQREIVNLLYESSDGLTPAEIDRWVSASRRYVHKTLDQIEQAPWCSVEYSKKHNEGNVYDTIRNPEYAVNIRISRCEQTVTSYKIQSVHT